MTNLLLFFALPIAVVIISIALQLIFKNPFLIAAIIFSIFLVVTFLVDDTLTFLIATIAYTLLAFLTAVLVKFIKKIIRALIRNEEEEDEEDNNNNNGCGRLNETIDVDSTLFQNTSVNGRTGDYYQYRNRR